MSRVLNAAFRFALVCVPILACGASAPHAPSPAVPVASGQGPGPTAPIASPAPTGCAASERIVRSFTETMRVEAYVTRGVPALDAFVTSLEATLARYRRAAPNRFEYRVIVPHDSTDRERAKSAGLTEESFGQASEGRASATMAKGFMGIVFSYGAERDTIPFLPPDRSDGVEFWLANKMVALSLRAKGTTLNIGVLKGHGEIGLDEPNLVPAAQGTPNMAQIVRMNFPYYALKDVDLRKGSAEVPASLDGLVVTQPDADLTDDELRRIDDHVMRGKPLVVFASAVNVRAGDARMGATVDTHRLDKLLGGYGINLHADAVLDFGRSHRVNVETKVGVASARFPYILEVQDDERFTAGRALLDPSFPAFFRVPEIMFPFASSVGVDPAKQPEARVRVLARSSPEAAVETSANVDLAPFRAWRAPGSLAQFALAAEVEGTIHSAFGPARKSAPNARVLVIASSQFLANPFARAGNSADKLNPLVAPTKADEILLQIAAAYARKELVDSMLVFKNTLDWMTLPDGLADCTAQSL